MGIKKNMGLLLHSNAFTLDKSLFICGFHLAYSIEILKKTTRPELTMYVNNLFIAPPMEHMPLFQCNISHVFTLIIYIKTIKIHVTMLIHICITLFYCLNLILINSMKNRCVLI